MVPLKVPIFFSLAILSVINTIIHSFLSLYQNLIYNFLIIIWDLGILKITSYIFLSFIVILAMP